MFFFDEFLLKQNQTTVQLYRNPNGNNIYSFWRSVMVRTIEYGTGTVTTGTGIPGGSTVITTLPSLHFWKVVYLIVIELRTCQDTLGVERKSDK